MMKKAVLSLFLLMISLSIMADEKINYLYVWAKDRSNIAYALNDNPKISFLDDCLLITVNGMDINYPIEELDYFEYGTSPTGIKNLETESELMSIEGEALLFPKLKANSVISIYALDGAQILMKRITMEGEYMFPLSNLNAGIYMVNVNGITYKIVKR